MTLGPIARRLLATVAALALVGVLAGCAAGSAGSQSDGQGDTVGAVRDQLVGRWVPTDEGSSPNAFVQFDDDGTVMLSDGCNGGQGTWSLDESGFSAETGPHTEMYCDGYVDTHTWLATTRSVQFEDGLLVLLGDSGSTIGRLTPDTTGAMPIEPGIGDGGTLPPAPTAEQLVGRWSPSDVDPSAASSPDGSVSSPLAGSYVQFAADGSIEVSDGCIVQTGSWSIDGQQLTTSVAQDVDKTGDRICDAVLRYTWLAGTHAAALLDGVVHIWDDLGNDIGLLTPQ